jgi:hypothetical protein
MAKRPFAFLLATVTTTVTVTALLASCSTPAKHGTLTQADMQALKSRPKRAILYSLRPDIPFTGEKTGFHGYKILGQTDLTAAEFRRAADDFINAVQSYSESDGIATCFNPRHGLRIRTGDHEYDFLLSYECHSLLVYVDKDDTASSKYGTSGSPKDLNRLLDSKKIRMAEEI